MDRDNISLATNAQGRDITIMDCKNYLKNKNKIELSNFIYDRLYGRYLKSFDYNSTKYSKDYKNGFVMMASCCLLIETYVSFRESKYKKTYGKSRECFCYFFTSENQFSTFSIGGRLPNGQFAEKKDGGIPNDFYFNVRCGILHNAETRNGWKITRKQEYPIFDSENKAINATKFANRLKFVLSDYKDALIAADFDTDQLWKNFKERLKLLIQQS